MSLRGAELAFLAGSRGIRRRTVLELGVETPLIDLTYAAEDSPRARLRAPMVEPAGRSALPTAPCTSSRIRPPSPWPCSCAALHPLIRSGAPVIHIFEPASEHGSPASTNCSSRPSACSPSKASPKAIFDAQLASTCWRATARSARAAGRFRAAHRAPPGHAALRGEPRAHALAAPDSGAGVSRLQLFAVGGVRGESRRGGNRARFEERRTSTCAAAITSRRTSSASPDRTASRWARSPDRNHPQACWIWVVADNLRLMAANAVVVARQLL